MGLEQYAADLRQEVLAKAEDPDSESFREESFTDLMLEYLSEYGEIDDGQVCCYQHARLGLRISGYGVSAQDECLDLFISHYTGRVPPVSLPKVEVEKEFKRLIKFMTTCITKQYYRELPESSPAFDLAYRIHELAMGEELSRIRLFFLTDAIAKLSLLEDVEDREIGKRIIPVSGQVWDIERLYRCWSSGRGRETVVVDFIHEYGEPISCLMTPDNPRMEYTAYLCLIPGTILSRVYEKHGPRLLERNVRSFLQAKSSVNQAIRKTIREQPRMFLAYNNGISATGQKVELVRTMDGYGIKAIVDLQIVNGGQTTASLYWSGTRDKADLSDVFVQMKLTVLKDPQQMDEIVPRISESANTQNKIQTADFSANHPYHRKLEELSRTIWAPAVSGIERETKWFYERARGQYVDARAREGSPAKRKAFEALHPPSQRFTKVDLAKFEHTWGMLPHYVSEGSQKNFTRFMTALKERPVVPDQRYYEDLIAKAILFKEAERIVSRQKYGGYRANIVTYSLAWMIQDAETKGLTISLASIWRYQRLQIEMERAIISVSAAVQKAIADPPNKSNVTEWCKRQDCWDTIRQLRISLPSSYYNVLVSKAFVTVHKLKVSETEEERQAVRRLAALGREVWRIVNNRNATEKFLTPREAVIVGRLTKRKPRPSEIREAIDILDRLPQYGIETKIVG